MFVPDNTEEARALAVLTALSHFLDNPTLSAPLTADATLVPALKQLMGTVSQALLPVEPRHTNRRKLLRSATSDLAGFVGGLRNAYEQNSPLTAGALGNIWDMIPGFHDFDEK